MFGQLIPGGEANLDFPSLISGQNILVGKGKGMASCYKVLAPDSFISEPQLWYTPRGKKEPLPNKETSSAEKE